MSISPTYSKSLPFNSQLFPLLSKTIFAFAISFVREELTKAIGKDIFDYASNVSSISVVEIANKLKAIAEETAKFPGTYLDMNILRMNIGDADNKISELNKKMADFQNGLDRLKSFGDLKVEDIPKECFKRKSKCKVVELLTKNLDNDARYNGTLATIENYKAELSKAETFNLGCISIGIPLPSSTTSIILSFSIVKISS